MFKHFQNVAVDEAGSDGSGRTAGCPVVTELEQGTIPLPEAPEYPPFHETEMGGAPGDPELSYDHAAALELTAGDKALLADMARTFCQTVHGLRYRLRDGLERCDAQLVRITAHTLLGSTRQFCAHRAAAAALEVETSAVAYDWAAVHRGILSLERELGRLIPDLTCLAASHSGEC